MRKLTSAKKANLPVDDPWRGLVEKVADAAEFKVDKVYFTDGYGAQVYAYKSGNVALTPGLITEMTPAEVRVIVRAAIAASIVPVVGWRLWLIIIGSLIVLSALGWFLEFRLHIPSTVLTLVVSGSIFARSMWQLKTKNLGIPKQLLKSDSVGDMEALAFCGDPDFLIATIHKQARFNRKRSKYDENPYNPLESEEYIAMRTAAIRRLG